MENDMEKTENHELRACLAELELKLARYQGAMIEISRILAGAQPPACAEPEPEIVAQQVAALKLEARGLQIELVAVKRQLAASVPPGGRDWPTKVEG